MISKFLDSKTDFIFYARNDKLNCNILLEEKKKLQKCGIHFDTFTNLFLEYLKVQF